MTRHREPTAALSNYVDALVGIGGQLTSILQHMYRHDSPHAPLDPAATLARLIADVIPRRLADRDVELKVATRLIGATAKAIEDNLFLVDDDAFDEQPINGSERLH